MQPDSDQLSNPQEKLNKEGPSRSVTVKKIISLSFLAGIWALKTFILPTLLFGLCYSGDFCRSGVIEMILNFIELSFDYLIVGLVIFVLIPNSWKKTKWTFLSLVLLLVLGVNISNIFFKISPELVAKQNVEAVNCDDEPHPSLVSYCKTYYQIKEKAPNACGQLAIIPESFRNYIWASEKTYYVDSTKNGWFFQPPIIDSRVSSGSDRTPQQQSEELLIKTRLKCYNHESLSDEGNTSCSNITDEYAKDSCLMKSVYRIELMDILNKTEKYNQLISVCNEVKNSYMKSDCQARVDMKIFFDSTR